MRFKPPPPDNSIGWRVEFRPMEIQVTDFENAAFAVFMVLITRAILSFDLNFYIPIAKVDANMETAHARDAVLERKFYFRKNPFSGRPSRATTSGSTTPNSVLPSRPPTPTGPVEDEYRLMSINEIINGTGYRPSPDAASANAQYHRHANGSTAAGEQQQQQQQHEDDSEAEDEGEGFPGLIPLVESYLDSVNVDIQTRCELATYLDLIRRRASGELWTAARWIRYFIASHPDYAHDSVVSEPVTKELVGAVIGIGERECTGRGWDGLGIRGLDRLLGKFSRGCGGDGS